MAANAQVHRHKESLIRNLMKTDFSLSLCVIESYICSYFLPCWATGLKGKKVKVEYSREEFRFTFLLNRWLQLNAANLKNTPEAISRNNEAWKHISCSDETSGMIRHRDCALVSSLAIVTIRISWLVLKIATILRYTLCFNT